VESQAPLPLGTPLTIIFWIDSEKIVTPALVRTCDPGVGMGIVIGSALKAMDVGNRENRQREI